VFSEVQEQEEKSGEWGGEAYDRTRNQGPEIGSSLSTQKRIHGQ
jgi:hypothetical protein